MNKHIRLRSLSLFLYAIIVVLLYSGNALAANTFEDPDGRYTIDLPKNWKLQPQAEKTVYVFQGKGSNVIIEYSEQNKTRENLFNDGFNTLKASGLVNAKVQGSIRNLKINNNKPFPSLLTNDYDLVGFILI